MSVRLRAGNFINYSKLSTLRSHTELLCAGIHTGYCLGYITSISDNFPLQHITWLVLSLFIPKLLSERLIRTLYSQHTVTVINLSLLAGDTDAIRCIDSMVPALLFCNHLLRMSTQVPVIIVSLVNSIIRYQMMFMSSSIFLNYMDKIIAVLK